MPSSASFMTAASLAWRTAWGLRHGALGLVLASSVFAAIAFGQETVALRRLGIDFGWESSADFVSILAAALVVLWSLRRRNEAGDWELRLAASHAILTLSRICGLSLVVALTSTASVLALLALERILVGVSSLDRGASTLVQALAVGLPLAALAPAVTAIGRNPRLRLAVWLGLGLTSSGIFGLGIPIPLDRLFALGQGDGPKLVATVAAALATSAGVLVSLALDPRVLHRTDTVPCASASSATSTATSKP